MKNIKRFEDLFESFDGEAMYHSGAVTGTYARMMDYNNQHPAIELEEEIVDYNDILRDIFSRLNKEELESANIDHTNDFDEIIDDIEYFLNVEKGISVSDGIIEFDTLDEDQEVLIGKHPVKLYHFTSSNFEDSIKEKGLEKGHSQTNPDGNSYSGIYLTTQVSGNEIDGYKHHIRQLGGDIILVEVKAYMNELQPDPDDADLASGKTQFIIDSVTPDRILNIEETY